MTRDEFVYCMPPVLFHHEYGYGRLVILEDTPTSKAACYKHEEATSFNNYENSWQELYKQFARQLKENGYIG